MEPSGPSVVSIVYTPRKVTPRRPQGHYTRVATNQALLAEFQGIVGDVRGGTGKRQINIMDAETLLQLQSEGFKTGPGELGEQIVVSGLLLSSLMVGSRIRLGSAIVEITLPRTGCDRFEMIQGKPKTSVAGRLGVLVRVITGGEVAVGDAVADLPAGQ